MSFPEQRNSKQPAAKNLQTAASLRRAKCAPSVPFTVQLKNQQPLTLVRLFRVLPGKRITGEALLNGKKVLAKLFISPRAARHAQREYRGLSALEQAGLPAPSLKLRSALAGGGYVLVSEFLQPSEPLRADQPGPALQLLGRLHRAGLTHTDLHSGNFLQHAGTLYLIDGDAVRKRRRTRSAKQILCDIAALTALAPDPAQETLLTAYRAGNPNFNPLPEQVQQAARKLRSRSIRRFLKKSLRNCTQFSVEKQFNRFTVVVNAEKAALAELLKNPNPTDNPTGLLKNGRSSTVFQVETPGGRVVIKRYNLKSPLHAFLRLWRPSRAWNAWEKGLLLQCLGIATPAPLAMIEERFGPLRRRAWIINRYCPGCPLAHHLDPDRPLSKPESAALAQLFTTLHRERISHGDLKATNLFWHDGHLFVLDLDAVKKHRFAATYSRAWHKDRSRFLRNWPAHSPLFQQLDQLLPS